MKYTRTIRYQYYQIKMFHKEQNGRKKIKVIDGIFDFPRWAKSLDEAGMIKKAIDFNNAINETLVEQIRYYVSELEKIYEIVRS